MSFQTFSLHQLGWRPAYAQHLELADFEAGFPARVMAVGHDRIALLSSRGRVDAVAEAGLVPGDWVMIGQSDGRVQRVLPRHAMLSLPADRRPQDSVANVDAVFIMSSCDAHFRLADLRRHLALAHDAQAAPVIVLLGAHAGVDVGFFVAAAQSLSPQAAVVAVDAYEPGSLSQLSSWLQPGSTVAVAGAGHGWFVDMIAEGDEAAGPMRLRCSAWGGWIVDLGPASMPAAVERDASCEPSAAVVELSFDLAS